MMGSDETRKQESSEPAQTFAGFVPPTSNFFLMPNEWTNITAEIDSLAELKVIEYVLRHTWGYQNAHGEHDQSKVISIDEFMDGRKRADGSRMDKGTKLSRPSVIDGLKRAVAHGYLKCVVDTSDQARIKKSYALNMRNDVKMLNTRGKESLPPTQSRIFTPAVKHLNRSSKETLPRSEKETLERHSQKERETLPNISDTQQESSLSPSLVKNSLLERLTDEEADFWQRWRALAHCEDDALNEKAATYVVKLAPKITTTQALQSLYDMSYDRLRELAQAEGRGEPTPPRLGNLVNCLPEWELAQAEKQRTAEQERKQRDHLSGSGRMSNLTEARLRGEAPPIRYDTPATRRAKAGMNNVAESLPTWLREKLKSKAPDEEVSV